MTAFGEPFGRDRDPAELAAEAMLEAIGRQTLLIEEIRDQFTEHLELQREILRLLMADRR